MIQLQILHGQMAGVSWTARHFPVRVGRADGNDLTLAEAGVWDEHFQIVLEAGVGFVLSTLTEAIVTVNQSAVRRQPLRPGDVIGLGSVKLRFWLAPAGRRSLRGPELAVWLLLAAMMAAQIWLLWRFLA
jgi:pSer/pThr/pTyr-binding forkhead associated (FHA) protein